MAKAKKTKPASEVPENVPTDGGVMDAAFDSLRKTYGNIFTSGDEKIAQKRHVISVSPSADIAFGGIVEGSFLTLAGPPKVGKSTLSLKFAAEAQKPENGSRRVFYVNVENRISKRDLTKCEGLITTPDMFTIIESTEEKILSNVDIYEISVELMKKFPNSVWIYDSISAILDRAVSEGGISTETRGKQYQAMGRFFDLTKDIVPINKISVVFISHVIANTSGKGMPTSIKAGNRQLYQNDYMLQALYAKPWTISGDSEDDDAEQIGQEVKWKVVTSSLHGKGRKFSSWLRFGIGIDDTRELIDHAMDVGLISKAGAWFSLDFLNGSDLLIGTDYEGKAMPKMQGAEKVWDVLRANPAWIKGLDKQIRELNGLTV